jgi:hypothetical protein
MLVMLLNSVCFDLHESRSERKEREGAAPVDAPPPTPLHRRRRRR